MPITRKGAVKKAAPKKAAAKKASGDNYFSNMISRSGTMPPVKKKAAKDKEYTFVKGSVFVAMSFKSKDGLEIFAAIKDVCKSLKLNARRVDENYSSGFIILEIIDMINKAEFIIFDLTYERPNVYYELGYAHGVGNSPSNILLIAKDKTQLHFDISALRTNFYKSTEDLRKIIKRNLIHMIKETRIYI